MSIANRKELLLRELASRIDAEAEGEVRQSLHNLSSAFFWRFQPEDLAQRSVDNLYACLNGLLAFMRQWPEDGPRVRIFTPEDDEQPWDRRYTTLVVLCQGIPFCTASVRGELNRRNLAIHTIVSCYWRSAANRGQMNSVSCRIPSSIFWKRSPLWCATSRR